MYTPSPAAPAGEDGGSGGGRGDTDTANTGAVGDAGSGDMQTWLNDMIGSVGLPNLMQMLAVEDDGAPLPQIPDDFEID